MCQSVNQRGGFAGLSSTVYRDDGEGLRPVAFLDWDVAAPDCRIHDVAHVCWQYLDLGPVVNDLAATSHRLRLMCDAYGLADRSQVVDTGGRLVEQPGEGTQPEAAQPVAAQRVGGIAGGEHIAVALVAAATAAAAAAAHGTARWSGAVVGEF